MQMPYPEGIYTPDKSSPGAKVIPMTKKQRKARAASKRARKARQRQRL